MSADEIDADEFVKYLESEKIFVQAHGQVNNTLKMYLYSKELQGENFHLIELVLNFSSLEVNYILKSTYPNNSSKYEDYFMKIIDPIL